MSDIEREEFEDWVLDKPYTISLEKDINGVYIDPLVQDWYDGFKAARTNTIPACDGQHDGGPCRDRKCYVKPDAVAHLVKQEFTGRYEVSAHRDKGRDPKYYSDPFPVYTTPPQPQAAAVPEKMGWNQATGRDGSMYTNGWNDCVDAMLSAQPPQEG